jgi:FAD/FMN-containing dehydrogenase
VGSYSKKQGCTIGALPQYIVNATEAADVALAMKWAADRNIRIVVKGTGHDLNGR